MPSKPTVQADTAFDAIVLHLSTLTTEHLRKLSGQVMAELRRRANPQATTVKPEAKPRLKSKPADAVAVPVQAPVAVPVNKSHDHMAHMRQRRAEVQAAKKALTYPVQKTAAKAADPVKAAAKAEYKARKQKYESANPFAVKKPTGELTHKRFPTAKDAMAWLSTWCNAAWMQKYAVVNAAA